MFVAVPHRFQMIGRQRLTRTCGVDVEIRKNSEYKKADRGEEGSILYGDCEIADRYCPKEQFAI